MRVIYPINFCEVVHNFQTKFGQGYEGPIRELPASIASLRKKLLLEENTELVTAIDAGDQEEILDALVDMQYVLSGTINAMGMRGVFNDAFLRVHHANMQKVLAPSRHESKRDSPHDIIKPEGWQKPDLSDLLKGENL
jgi:predicted HAD superfamily Cof-like phosphohydrolase